MQISSRGEETPSESADGEAIEVLGSDVPQQANEDGDHWPSLEFSRLIPRLGNHNFATA
ncbi:MAG: hypothetical protein JWR46_1510 [Mycobacterium sp.]|jgi:hypothetical protein|nr:hypothetical protein [Mycobacterium sp.]